MPLPQANWAGMKADIAANSNTVTLNGVTQAISATPNQPDWNQAVADWYNATAAPAFVLWKRKETLEAVGKAFVSTEVAGLTANNLSRLQVMAQYAPNGFDPSRADTRAAFDDVFSGAGGANTRTALLALWKRTATRVEKVFATGTGSDAVPAVSAFADGFVLTAGDVLSSRNS